MGDVLILLPDRLRNNSGDADAIFKLGISKYEAHGAGLFSRIKLNKPRRFGFESSADNWRQAELIRARKLIEKGQPLEEVLEAFSLGLMKKMLNGPLRELHHAEGEQRGKARDAVKQMFLHS